MGRFAIMLLCSAPVLAAPVPKALKKVTPTLQGVWELVERRNDDKPVGIVGKEFWVIDETGYAIYRGVKNVTAILDPAVKPHLGKWKHTGDDPTAFDTFGGGVDNTGRLELDSDFMKIGFDLTYKENRPAEAKAAVGVGYILFKRVDDPRLKAK